MTDQTPVERAASYIITKPRKGARTYREYAQDAYEAIDTSQLADVLSALTTCDGQPNASELHRRQALAVKNWLTGK